VSVSPLPSDVLVLERSFAAAPVEVFDAWTCPEVLARWWTAYPGWTASVCEVELRVGGSYRLGMRDRDGREYVVTGEYREVERPSRLVYTWCWQADELHPGHVSLVTVQFTAEDDGTVVTLVHSGLPSRESRARHARGWSGTLAKLTQLINDTAEEGTTTPGG
jgi:uncharacterized protein YndB with AHSA1/START domain